MTDIDPELLHGRWVHSHEEDTPGERVFRVSSYPFPPSRGRSTLDLGTDGRYTQTEPGPTDRPQATEPGTWTCSGDTLELRPHAGATETFTITAATPGRLVLKQ